LAHLLFALTVAAVLLQATPARLAGTWVAELNGLTFVRLELKAENGRLTGGLATGNEIHVDNTGVVDRADEASTTHIPIADAAIAGDVLSFTRREGNEPDHFRVRLTGDRSAELTIVISDDDLEDLKDAGVPAPKPIRLRKLR
jgi:hypothetical protein